MDEQPTNNPVESKPLSRSEARRQRHEARREALGGGGSLAWITGIILILLGLGFLLQNMGKISIQLHNWWALFILLPAIGAFEIALRRYKDHGNRFVASARSSLLSGSILVIVALGFLFEINWTYFGPMLIVLAGIGILFNSFQQGKD